MAILIESLSILGKIPDALNVRHQHTTALLLPSLLPLSTSHHSTILFSEEILYLLLPSPLFSLLFSPSSPPYI